MTVSNQVRKLVERLSPAPICDECISERLGLSGCQDASAVARELAGTRGFERRKDTCAICGCEKTAIRYQSQ